MSEEETREAAVFLPEPPNPITHTLQPRATVGVGVVGM